jgi:hypothetical protein
MQLLIVHRDPEMGEALVQMMKSYMRHACDLVRELLFDAITVQKGDNPIPSRQRSA